MQSGQDAEALRAIPRASRSPVSVALLAGVAFVPIVVAAGFLTDRDPTGVPADISVAAIRGAFDRGAVDHAPSVSAGW